MCMLELLQQRACAWPASDVHSLCRDVREDLGKDEKEGQGKEEALEEDKAKDRFKHAGGDVEKAPLASARHDVAQRPLIFRGLWKAKELHSSVEFVEDMLVCLAKFHLPNPQSLPTVMAYRNEEYLFLGTIDNEKRQKSRQ